MSVREIQNKKKDWNNKLEYFLIYDLYSSKSMRMEIYTTLNIIFLDLIDIIKDKIEKLNKNP